MSHKTKTRAWISSLGIFFILFMISTLVILITASPSVQAQPETTIDQFVFKYVGQQMLEGQVVYKDIWDHKGVLIYLFYILGFIINNDYGIWILACLWLTLSIILFYLLTKDIVQSKNIAFFSSITFLIYLPFVLEGGSSIEFYNLLFQILCIYFLWKIIVGDKVRLFSYLIGISASLSFFLRPNEISVQLAAFLFFLLFKAREESFFPILLNASLGALSILIPVFVLLSFYGAFENYLDIVIIYNTIYSQVTPYRRQTFFGGAHLFIFAFVPAMTEWFMLPFIHKRSSLSDIQKEFFYFIGIAFPIVLFLSMISGRGFYHYYISWLPVMMMLLAFFLTNIAKKMQNHQQKTWNFFVQTGSVLLVFLFFMQNWSYIRPFFSAGSFKIALEAEASAPEREYIAFIQENTNETDTLWVWGNALKYNVLTKREAPSKYIYLYPLLLPKYTTREMVSEQIAALAKKKTMILDVSVSDGLVQPITSPFYKETYLAPLVNYIKSNYLPIDDVGTLDFIVWIPK